MPAGGNPSLLVGAPRPSVVILFRPRLGDHMRRIFTLCLITSTAAGCLISEEIRLGAYDRDYDGHLHPLGGGDDCDDLDAQIYPGADDPFGDEVDQDCDGLDGVDNDEDGYASDITGGPDCDDMNPAVRPDALDTVGNNVDENCDQTDGVDVDSDGYASIASDGTDCDDNNPYTHPSADDQVGNGVDDNCDGRDGVDDDLDDWASVASGGTDCNDADDAIHPNVDDTVGNTIDENCDGVDGLDQDLDGYASISSGGTDCDDTSGLFHPGAADLVGDGADQNCDDLDGVDKDQDGWASLTSGGDDCEDTNSDISPGEPESCNGEDENCDQVLDDGFPQTWFFEDLDNDGFGTEAASIQACAAPPGFAAILTDCNDFDDDVWPGAADLVGDGDDRNCDGIDGVDNDQDWFASQASGGTDCDDGNLNVYPGAADLVGDSQDSNCDGIDGVDSDGDGFASEASGGLDCHDGLDTVNPSANDLVGDATDRNCDGHDGIDSDQDGQASLPSGGTDCNDASEDIGAGFEEIPYDGIDQDCADGDLTDVDGDQVDGIPAGGDDCDDDNPARNPMEPDEVGDGIDQNCDEVDGVDSDGDLEPSEASGGTDCNDQSPTVGLAAPEILLDGIDQNCDGDDNASVVWLTDDIRIDPTKDGGQWPTLKWSDDGAHYMIAWGFGGKIRGQVFTSDDEPLFEAGVIGFDGSTEHPAVTWHEDEPVVVWGDTSTAQVRVMKVGLDGEPVTAPIDIATLSPPALQTDMIVPEIAVGATVMVSWLNWEDGVGGVYGLQQLSDQMEPLGPPVDYPSSNPIEIAGRHGLVATSGTQFLMTAIDRATAFPKVWGQYFFANGTPDGTFFELVSGLDGNDLVDWSALTIDDDDNYMVAATADRGGLYIRPFTATDSPAADAVAVDTEGMQSRLAHVAGVTALAHTSPDLDGEGVYLTVYEHSTGRVLANTQLATVTETDIQSLPSIDLVVHNDVVQGVLAWQRSQSATPSNDGIWLRRFSLGLVP